MGRKQTKLWLYVISLSAWHIYIDNLQAFLSRKHVID